MIDLPKLRPEPAVAPCRRCGERLTFSSTIFVDGSGVRWRPSKFCRACETWNRFPRQLRGLPDKWAIQEALGEIIEAATRGRSA